MREELLTELGNGFFIDPEYASQLDTLDLTSLEAFFDTSHGKQLVKPGLGIHRSRSAIALPRMDIKAYLKCYVDPPRLRQIKYWLQHRAIAPTAWYDHYNASVLAKAGIRTPTTIAYGFEMDGWFEKRSFILSLEVPGASLEKTLPPYCKDLSDHSRGRKKKFIAALAAFIRKFHDTGFRHRDLYLCHIFYNEPEFYLIDLTRCFIPYMLKQRYAVKDIAQLYFSAPGSVFSSTDRMRFILAYTGRTRLDAHSRKLARSILTKVESMTYHNRRHGKIAPYESL